MPSVRRATPGRHRCALTLACLPLLTFLTPASLRADADTTTWTGSAADTLWSSPANWEPAPPTASTSVTLPTDTLVNNTTIDLGGATQTVNDLTFTPGGYYSYTLANGTLSLNSLTNASDFSTPHTLSANLTTPSGTLALDAQSGSLTLDGVVTAPTLNVTNTVATGQANLYFNNPANSLSTLTVGSAQYYGAHVVAATPGSLGTASLVGSYGAAFTFTGVDPGATTTYHNALSVSNSVNVQVAPTSAGTTPNAAVALDALSFSDANNYAFFESNANTHLSFASTTINGYTSFYSYTFDPNTRAFLDLGSVSESSPTSTLSSYGFGTTSLSGPGSYTGDTHVSGGGLLVAAHPASFGTNPNSVVYAQFGGTVQFLAPQVPFHRVYVDGTSGLGGDLTGAVFSGPGQNVFLSEGATLLATSSTVPARGTDVDHPAYFLGLQSPDLTSTTGDDPAHTSIFKGIALGQYTPNVPYGGYTGTVSSYSGSDPVEVYLNNGFWPLINVQFNTTDTTTGLHFQGPGEARIGASHGTAAVITATGDPTTDTSNNYVLSFGDHATLAPGESAHVSNGDLYTGYPDSVSDGATVTIHGTATYVIGNYADTPDGSPTTGTFNVDPGAAVYLTNPSFNVTSGATFNFAPGSLLVFDAYYGTVDNSNPNSLPPTADIVVKTFNTPLTFTSPIPLGDGRRLTASADQSVEISAPALTSAPGAALVRLSAPANQTLTLDAPVQLPGVDLTIGDDDGTGNHAFNTIQYFTQHAPIDQTGAVTVNGTLAAHDLTILSGDFTLNAYATSTTDPATASVNNLTHSSPGATTINAESLTLGGSLHQTAGYVTINAPINFGPGASITVDGGYLNLAPSSPPTLSDFRHQLTIGPSAIVYLDGPSDPLSDDANGHAFDVHNEGSLINYTYTSLGSLSGNGITINYGPALTADSLHQPTLDVQSGTVYLRPGAGPSRLSALTINTATGASLDLANNKLVLDYTGPTPLDAIRSYLLTHQLFSSTADADPQHRLAIAYAEASQLQVSTWATLPVDTTAILTKLTYLGDANLDGLINSDDFALFDRGLAKHLTGWTAGDFNYDNTVNAADALLLDSTYTTQSGTLPSPDLLAQRESQFGPAYVQSLLATVPEPTSLSAACALSLHLLSRRRRPR